MRFHFSLLAAASLAVVAACSDTPPTRPSAEEPDLEPTFAAAGGPQVIPGRFIITVRDGVDPAAVVRDHGVAPQFVYRHALNGFAGAMSDAARNGLLRDARVRRVEPDGVVRAVEIENAQSWGLDRIDARSGLDGTYRYTSTGSGVTVYIIDTGIRFDHAEFKNPDGTSRAVSGYDAVEDDTNADDCHGHGTHVAGTVGGKTYGVAKAVGLVAVRVLNCNGSGTWSGVIAGINWVTANHQAGVPAVANMSLGGGANASVDNAVQNMISDGVSTAVAAGNGNIFGIAQDACKYSPARVPEAMTVAAADWSDFKVSWSNYGTCVDWFAPGYKIKSAWHTDAAATNTISGTSMAAPHSAGVAALYLQSNQVATPEAVRTALYNNTTKDVVKSSRTRNNHLLFTDY